MSQHSRCQHAVREPSVGSVLCFSGRSSNGWLGGFKYFLCLPRSLGKWSNLTNIFQVGWNHQQDECPSNSCWHRSLIFMRFGKVLHFKKQYGPTVSCLLPLGRWLLNNKLCEFEIRKNVKWFDHLDVQQTVTWWLWFVIFRRSAKSLFHNITIFPSHKVNLVG